MFPSIYHGESQEWYQEMLGAIKLVQGKVDVRLDYDGCIRDG
jgi:hypothetical protein